MNLGFKVTRIKNKEARGGRRMGRRGEEAEDGTRHKLSVTRAWDAVYHTTRRKRPATHKDGVRTQR